MRYWKGQTVMGGDVVMIYAGARSFERMGLEMRCVENIPAMR